MRTQSERILTVLRDDGELCGVEPLHWSPPITRVAARVYDLRDRGYLIETVNCDRHRQPGGPHAKYKYLGHDAWRAP